jgi:DNA-binding transcriptional MerR regulator
VDNSGNVIGAFSEEFAEQLTGLSRRQLRYWDRTGFFRPGISDENRRLAFSRIYTFRDLVSLRVLARLRNELDVPLQHLREVAHKLSHLKDAKWTTTTLYVLNRRVVFDHPETGLRQEVVSGQGVLEIPLQVAISETRQRIAEAAERPATQVGKVIRNRFVRHNDVVVAGTRIPVDAIKNFHEDGFSTDEILAEYPGLTRRDVEAALSFGTGIVAA